MKSPGHRKHPDHQIVEKRVKEPITIAMGDATLAETSDAIRVEEDGQPPRYYVPITTVEAHLEPSPKETQCPFKGTAHYYNVLAGGQMYENAAWTYDEPYDEHAALAGRVAFDDARLPDFTVH